MTAGFTVLRPEPGNAATTEALAREDHDVLRLPLFEVCSLAWQPPDPTDFDALLLTSANAARHAGDGLHVLARLPVVAVGEATAAAARDAGLAIAITGDDDGESVLAAARAHGFDRLIHLAGRDHRALAGVTAIPVYASRERPVAPDDLTALRGRVALLHSPRAARRLAVLIPNGREQIALAALSQAVAIAAGENWRAVTVAARPTDAALRDAAIALAAEIDRSPRRGDKRP